MTRDSLIVSLIEDRIDSFAQRWNRMAWSNLCGVFIAFIFISEKEINAI